MLETHVLIFTLLAMLASSMADVPKLKMNNGREMPGIALGTYLGSDQNGVMRSVNKTLRDVVLRALDLGYRHFDSAAVYETEAELGEAVRMKIETGLVKRDEVFITTKLWNTQHKRENVTLALRAALDKMRLDYVDLYLMHWPLGLNDDYTFSQTDYMETWRGMEDVQRMGLAKSIGLSNFNKEQMTRVFQEGSIKPAALQIEIHPQIIQKELVEYAQSEGVVVMGYSPFGSLVMRYGFHFPGPKMDDPLLTGIAKKYGKSTPQVVLRWLVDRSIVPIPKSVNALRLKQNFDIFDFKLEKSEIDAINAFDSHTRYTFPSFWQSHPYYPFEKIDNPLADPFKPQATG